MRDTAARDIDWSRFVEMAVGHRVVLPVQRALTGLPVPADVQARLADAARRAGLRALAAAAEAVRTVRALDAEGVPALALKGPVEAVVSWGGPGGREASDVDLFVRPADAQRATAALLGLGLVPTVPAAVPFVGTGWLQTAELGFLSRDRGTLVDLHWGFTSPRVLFPIDVADAVARAPAVPVAGTPVRTLPDAETFLYLCVHGSIHGWSRLSWLCDVAERLRHGRDGGERTGALARAMDLARPLAAGCHLASGLLGAPLPDWCPPLDRTARRLVSQWTPPLTAVPDENARAGRRATLERLPTDVALLTRPAGKLAVLAALLRLREGDMREAPDCSVTGLFLRRLARLFRHGPRKTRG